METKEERLARRQRERTDRMKASPGYKTFAVMFTVLYPFIAVFTFLFTGLLTVFSGISQGLAWVMSGGKSR
jgi:antibiotic biosynthesis monooxygenase (ABM) superfamily enzyme